MLASHSSLKRANSLLGLQFISDFGDQITTSLLALVLLDITNSTDQVGMVYLITTLGFVLFTFLGGVLGDRLSRRKLLFSCDMGRGLTVLLMIVAVHHKSILLIYLTSFLLSILGSLHRPAKLSAWTESIPNGYLERYNSLSELSIQISYILGPVIASFFIMRQWIDWGFGIDAITFFACAIIFSMIISEKRQPITPIKSNRDLLQGFKLLVRHQVLVRYVSYDAIQMIGYGAFNATFLVLAQRDFGWTKIEYSYHLSIIALFTALGAMLGATRLIASINSLIKLICCALISGILLFIMLYIESFPLGSILFGICDALAILTVSVTRTKAQVIAKEDHPDHLASIIAARSIVIKFATLIGTSLCLILDDIISLKYALIVFAFPVLLSFIPFLLPRPRDRTMPLSSPSLSRIS